MGHHDRAHDALNAVLLAGMLLLAAGCGWRPALERWQEDLRSWQEHPSHFASKDHLVFSVKNVGPPTVTREDFSRARDEGWWGRPVAVPQGAILDR